MKRLRTVTVATLVLGATALASGQTPGPPRTQVLRGRIETAFLEQVSRELALTADQRAAVNRILVAHGDRRRDLETEARQLQRSLERHLRPGVAANEDSVSRAVDRMLGNRVEYAESFRAEMRDLTPILSPVQRAQFLTLRDRVFRRIQELQDGRGRPGAPIREPGRSP